MKKHLSYAHLAIAIIALILVLWARAHRLTPLRIQLAPTSPIETPEQRMYRAYLPVVARQNESIHGRAVFILPQTQTATIEKSIPVTLWINAPDVQAVEVFVDYGELSWARLSLSAPCDISNAIAQRDDGISYECEVSEPFSGLRKLATIEFVASFTGTFTITPSAFVGLPSGGGYWPSGRISRIEIVDATNP